MEIMMNEIYNFVEETRKTGKPTSFEVEGERHIFLVTVELVDGEIYFTYTVRTNSNDTVWDDFSGVEQFVYEQAFYPEYESTENNSSPVENAYVINKPEKEEILQAIRNTEDVIFEDDTKLIFRPK